ncbi:hypothetical protein P7H06_00035 [Paenibacillus larvae]|nr:hypothetical protein [Paenibacillus larvae]MDT2258279.1 hypothetical protein [Paenibacillus larvae]
MENVELPLNLQLFAEGEGGERWRRWRRWRRANEGRGDDKNIYARRARQNRS